MANSIVAKALSCTWKGAAVNGAISFSIEKTGEFAEDQSDGAVYLKYPGTVLKRRVATVNFQYMDKAIAIVDGDVGALVLVGKGANAGGNVTCTIAAAFVRSVRANADGSGHSVTFEAYATDGTTDPLVVT